MITWDDFEKVELCVGTVTRCEAFPEARKPAYKVWVDLGATVGIRASSAQITHRYTPESLIGRQVVCVTNFPPRQIGPFISEVLICGFYNADGSVTLVGPDTSVENGTRLA